MTYRTIVVGTDGSPSSLRAVDRAGAVAAQDNAKLIIANAHLGTEERGGWSRPPSPDRITDRRAEDALGGEGSYKMHGSAHSYEVLREARGRAEAAGARSVAERSIVGAPVDVLVNLAKEAEADLIVVGDVGLDTVAGRLLGSVPSTIARRVKIDILIVHTAEDAPT
ncbi:MAG TPA: universal stress protein [Mycobacteriales bacterium]|nr:universal stress protein [Mycobacteriales bacterium]